MLTTLPIILAVATIVLTLLHYFFNNSTFWIRWKDAFSIHRPNPAALAVQKSKRQRSIASFANTFQTVGDEKSRLYLYRDLYFKLQNLEYHREVLPQAQNALLECLSEAVHKQNFLGEESILAVQHYRPEELEGFLTAEHQETLRHYQRYLERTGSGAFPHAELFTDRQEAADWLKQKAPVKYVDGAWLGHMHRITTPFGLRYVTKNAWQVLSEELGDGFQRSNHVFLYRELLQEVGCTLPDAHSIDFTHPQHGMDDIHVWKAAVVQLLISLFPNDFLPEILGFNMHFEQLTLETLKAARELRLLGISGYYFLLHISIDNLDSGHAAMALRTVVQYMSLVRDTEGCLAAEQAWKRIQAGYILSKRLESGADAGDWAARKLTTQESKVLGIFKRKAQVSQELHCKSRIRIGQHSLADWLLLCSSSNQPGHLLDSLADSSPWIRKGDSEKSQLVRELSAGGRMFGAFTNSEIDELRRWIRTMPISVGPQEAAYLSSRNTALATPVVDPVLDLPARPRALILKDLDPGQCRSVIFRPQPLRFTRAGIAPATLIPLWFAHLGLLENFVGTPFRTSTQLGSLIVRILRAEYGFPPETGGVAGLDEFSSSHYSPSLIELGIKMARGYNWSPLTCIQDVMENKNALTGESSNRVLRFAYSMLSWAKRPYEGTTFLLGLARSFLDLEMWVTGNHELLAERDRRALRHIVERKGKCFQLCLDELKDDERQLFVWGYDYGRSEIDFFCNII
jgi:hypothetical protein